MQRLTLSTDDVPEAERFPYWRDAVSKGYVGVAAERNTDQETPFHGKSVAWIGESVARIRCRYDGHRIVRRPSDIARVGHEDCIFIYREAGQGTRFEHGGREFVTVPGDLTIADPTVPFSAEPRSGYDHELWFFPRRLIEPHLSASQRPRWLVHRDSSGVGGLVKAYLDAFGAQLDTLDDSWAGVVADNFCRLLAVVCGAAAGEHGDAIRVGRLADAKLYVDQHLSNPRLSPEKAARALKISVRRLHHLFEPSGTTFTQYLLSRRLEECRAALVNGDRPVTDIALAWGFNSLATFNRTFRRAFGVAPSELRRAGRPH
jgi:AraC-like DNA-binding protein